MATAAQFTANRANAQHSTGPRTPEGKARSARNHTGHGLSSREFVILPHQEAEFEEFMTGLHHDVQPHGFLEHDLFTQFAHAAWNLRRCRQAERELQDAHTPGLDPILDAQAADRLRLIDLYARRSERTYHRLLKELKALQTNRRYVNEVEGILELPSSGYLPAPLAQNLALENTRMRAFKSAARGHENRLFTQVRSEFVEELARTNWNETPRGVEQSNPIPPGAPAAAAR
jgi:hypothetical protein